jgi:hypothetical protein
MPAGMSDEVRVRNRCSTWQIYVFSGIYCCTNAVQSNNLWIGLSECMLPFLKGCAHQRKPGVLFHRFEGDESEEREDLTLEPVYARLNTAIKSLRASLWANVCPRGTCGDPVRSDTWT